MAAEYSGLARQLDVVLCERGIRTFETLTRNTLDLNAIPVWSLTHLPVVVDPSTASGCPGRWPPWPGPPPPYGVDGSSWRSTPSRSALSDGPQSLAIPEFAELMRQVKVIAKAVGRGRVAALQPSEAEPPGAGRSCTVRRPLRRLTRGSRDRVRSPLRQSRGTHMADGLVAAACLREEQRQGLRSGDAGELRPTRLHSVLPRQRCRSRGPESRERAGGPWKVFRVGRSYQEEALRHTAPRGHL